MTPTRPTSAQREAKYEELVIRVDERLGIIADAVSKMTDDIYGNGGPGLKEKVRTLENNAIQATKVTAAVQDVCGRLVDMENKHEFELEEAKTRKAEWSKLRFWFTTTIGAILLNILLHFLNL